MRTETADAHREDGLGSSSAEFPERVGRYELLVPIGTGGMGTVYLARTEVLTGVHRELAVKLMHAQLRATSDVAEELMREARLAASIRHTNVVEVVEAGDSPFGVFLAMDYVEGDTVAGLIRAARQTEDLVPLGVVGRILYDALTGLHAAHELRDGDGRAMEIVHRDFSPQNILVGVDGITRLTDFGIAKAVSQLGVTATGIVKGKASYMAPEQARGQPLDRRCDVWAAGVVTWELLAGRRLFQEANDTATVLKIISSDPLPRVSPFRGETSAEMEEVVLAALRQEPSRRAATALELRSRLEAAWQTQGGLASPEEVGRYVRQATAKKLAARRAHIHEVLSLRKKLRRVSMTAERMAKENARGLTPSNQERTTEETTTLMVAEARGGGRLSLRRLPRAAFLASLLAAVVALLLWTSLRAKKPQAEVRPVAAVAPSERPEPNSPAAPSVPQEAAPAAHLHVRANAPIQQLRLGARSLVLADAVLEVDVTLTPDERDRALDILAISNDGRRAKANLSSGQRDATLAFSEARLPTRVPARRPLPSGGASAPGKAGPGLADSPYGHP